MAKEDLSGMKLDHVSLADANLSEADLSQASLRYAHLERAKLEKATLAESDLHGAYLTQADLRGADLRGTDLSEADLRGTDLAQAAALDGARLEDAKGVPPEVAERAAQTVDRVTGVGWKTDEPGSDDVADEEAYVLYVARALARAAGFHATDWEHALTEPERQLHVRDARAAIAAVGEYAKGAGQPDRRRCQAPDRPARTQPHDLEVPTQAAARRSGADDLRAHMRAQDAPGSPA
jgi:uncharacterized protein YjbI with pentapeptide repeats